MGDKFEKYDKVQLGNRLHDVTKFLFWTFTAINGVAATDNLDMTVTKFTLYVVASYGPRFIRVKVCVPSHPRSREVGVS